MKTSPFLLAAAVLAAAGAPAHAQQASAAASLSNIRIELIDLNLSDNIDPWIYFSTPAQAASARQQMPYDGEATWANGVVEVIGTAGGARATLGADVVSASSWSLAGTDATSFDSEAWRSVSFTLSPNTGLMFLADGALDVESQGGDLGHDSTAASISLRLHLQQSDDITIHKDVERFYSSEQGQRDLRLSAYLASGKHEMNGYYTVRARSEANYLAAPVPEPAGWGMLLAGAALVGAAVRRRPLAQS